MSVVVCGLIVEPKNVKYIDSATCKHKKRTVNCYKLYCQSLYSGTKLEIIMYERPTLSDSYQSSTLSDLSVYGHFETDSLTEFPKFTHIPKEQCVIKLSPDYYFQSDIDCELFQFSINGEGSYCMPSGYVKFNMDNFTSS